MHVSKNAEHFDHWIRTRFIDFNTDLETLYFAQDDKDLIEGVGDNIKATLEEEGRRFIVALLDEGNTDEGFDRAFDLLGNLGLYMAALRRHELTNPDREERSPFQAASALGLHIGASVGLVPRFATSHLATHNRAVDGKIKSFTSLEQEHFFVNANTAGIIGYMRASDALKRIVPLGVSHPITPLLLKQAGDALNDVATSNRKLNDKLDVDRFFYSVRPYYKPYRVGRHIYRGANAGDFSGINEIDMLLGLCNANDPYYAQLLLDKMLFMRPEDQTSLRDCMRRRSLLDQLLDQIDRANTPWFQENATAFLAVCAAHGATASQHHDQLVARFIEAPSKAVGDDKLDQITASGPPLPVLLRALEHLRDLRLAAPRDDIATAHNKIQRLRNALT
ncbi:MAG: monodechloroaminopyrrolnitrin synthase PrnB family protein [Pseudomonadota bacterium]